MALNPHDAGAGNGERWYLSSPIAHRGLFDEQLGRPENSLEAFASAVAHGVPFEFDIQISADGVPVVVHDRSLEYLTGPPTPVCEMRVEEIRRVRRGLSEAVIPLLEEVLEVVDGAVPMVLDVRRWSIRESSGLERAVADRVKSYRGAYVVQSFDPLALIRFKKLLDGVAIAQASGSLKSAHWLARQIGRTMLTNVAVRPDFISYELDDLPAAFVRLWRRSGIPVVAWTSHSVEDQSKAERYADNFFFSGYTPVREGTR